MLFNLKRTSFTGLASLLTVLACGGSPSAPTDLNAGRRALTNPVSAPVQAGAQNAAGAQVQDDDDVCVADADCDADELCTAGVCTDVDDDDDDVCAADADCDADEICTNGTCEDI